MEDVLAQITVIGKEPNRILEALHSSRTGANVVSHTIFQLNPTNESRELEKCHCGVVSRWAFDSLLAALRNKRS
jgi:hypothetical protein